MIERNKMCSAYKREKTILTRLGINYSKERKYDGKTVTTNDQ
jgi:hypothetical protein